MAQYLCIWVRAYWFSVTLFSKWLSAGHIWFFVFWTAWFRQHNSSLLWNFSFKFHVHVLCGCRQKLNDCQLRHFQNGCPPPPPPPPRVAALWFWTMFNCNPPIAHCHPLLWGGGFGLDWICLTTTHVLQDILAVLHKWMSQNCFYYLNNYSSPIILSILGASWS